MTMRLEDADALPLQFFKVLRTDLPPFEKKYKEFTKLLSRIAEIHTTVARAPQKLNRQKALVDHFQELAARHSRMVEQQLHVCEMLSSPMNSDLKDIDRLIDYVSKLVTAMYNVLKESADWWILVFNSASDVTTQETLEAIYEEILPCVVVIGSLGDDLFDNCAKLGFITSFK